MITIFSKDQNQCMTYRYFLYLLIHLYNMIDSGIITELSRTDTTRALDWPRLSALARDCSFSIRFQ